MYMDTPPGPGEGHEPEEGNSHQGNGNEAHDYQGDSIEEHVHEQVCEGTGIHDLRTDPRYAKYNFPERPGYYIKRFMWSIYNRRIGRRVYPKGGRPFPWWEKLPEEVEPPQGGLENE